MNRTLRTVGKNPYSGHDITRVRVGAFHVSWNGDNLMVFGIGAHKGFDVDFGWDTEDNIRSSREVLVNALDEVGPVGLRAWMATLTPDPDSGRVTYDPTTFAMWVSVQNEPSTVDEPACRVTSPEPHLRGEFPMSCSACHQYENWD